MKYIISLILFFMSSFLNVMLAQGVANGSNAHWWESGWIQVIGFCIIGVSGWVLFRLVKDYHQRNQKKLEALVNAKVAEIQQQKKEIEDQNKKLELQTEQITQQADVITNALFDLEKLTEIGKILTANLSTEKIIDLVYKSIKEVMDAHLFGFGMYNKSNNSLEFMHVLLRGERMPFVSFPVDEDQRLSVKCLLNDEEVVIGDLQSELSNYADDIRTVPGDTNSQSIIYIPLKVKGKSFGVITVQSDKKVAYSSYHLNFLRNIAIYASIALENTRVFQALDEQRLSLEMAHNDISQRKLEVEEQRNQLKALNDENVQLLKLFTSELKQPLAISLREIEELKKQCLHDNEKNCDALHLIMESLWQINEMVSQIDEIKSIQHIKVKYNTVPFRVADVINQTLTNYKEFLERKQIEVKFEPTLVQLKVDASYFGKVISNLLSNGIKFSYPKSTIHINIDEQDDFVLCSIKDEGPGLSAEDHDRLFSKFQKLSARPTGNELSSGLGLYLVKCYMDEMQGDIWCESVKGEGANFIVKLPK